MTVAETLLVYVGAPLVIILVLALLTLVPGRKKRPRYRPGQPWEHAPIWYAPHAENGDDHGDEHGDGHAALGAGGATAIGAGASAPVPAVGGPRGGARGTW